MLPLATATIFIVFISRLDLSSVPSASVPTFIAGARHASYLPLQSWIGSLVAYSSSLLPAIIPFRCSPLGACQTARLARDLRCLIYRESFVYKHLWVSVGKGGAFFIEQVVEGSRYRQDCILQLSLTRLQYFFQASIFYHYDSIIFQVSTTSQ